MKKITAIFILGTLLMSTTYVFAAAIKIGYVDVAKVFDEYSETKKAKANLEQEIRTKQETIGKMSEEVKTLRQSFESQQAGLSEDLKKQRLAEIDKKSQDLQKFTENAEQELTKKEAELTEKILAKIYDIVQNLGKEKGYTLILDKNNVIYGLEELNLTSEVLKKLDQQTKQDTGNPSQETMPANLPPTTPPPAGSEQKPPQPSTK